MKKGFTLIELMVVISIIGTLSAIAIPRFMNITKGAKIAQIQANRKNLETAFAIYMAKEDKSIEDAFGREGNKWDSVMSDKNQTYFEANYMNKKTPYLPDTKRNKFYHVTDNDFLPGMMDLYFEIEEFKKADIGWLVHENGTVYPAVKENIYGIRYDGF